jgi:hypothetical protein
MMIRQQIGIVVLVLLAGAARANAQQASSYERARAGMSASAAVEFERVVNDARARGLPQQALVDKALEGQAKHVPPDRIVLVLRDLSDRLQRARTALGPGAASADVVAVADVLQRGVTTTTIGQLSAHLPPGESIAIVAQVYADVVGRGVPADRALDLLVAWEGRKNRTGEVRDVAGAIERLVRQGQPPAQAAAALTAGIRAGRALDAISLPLLRSEATMPDIMSSFAGAVHIKPPILGLVGVNLP